MQSLWMLASALAFAVLGVFVKLAVDWYGVGELVFYRNLMTLLAMTVALRRSGLSISSAHLGAHVKRSLMGVAGVGLGFLAISMLPLATAVTLSRLSSVWIAVFLGIGVAISGGRLDRRLVLAIFVSFLGVICLLQPVFRTEQFMGGLVGLVGGMCTARAYIEVRKLGELGEPETRVVFWFSVIGAVSGLVWALAAGGLHAHRWPGVGLLLMVGVSATIAQTTMTRAFQRGSTLLSANLQYATIVFATLFGMWIWGDRLTALSWFGMLLIVASGVAASVLRARSGRG